MKSTWTALYCLCNHLWFLQLFKKQKNPASPLKKEKHKYLVLKITVEYNYLSTHTGCIVCLHCQNLHVVKHRPFINGCARLVMKGGPYEDQTNLHRREVSKCICFAPFRNITVKWTPSLILRSNVRSVIKCHSVFSKERSSQGTLLRLSAQESNKEALWHTLPTRGR